MKENEDKKLAVTVFSFPPDKGNVGTAAYLDVFGSILRVAQELKSKGYDLGGRAARDARGPHEIGAEGQGGEARLARRSTSRTA